LLPSPLKSPPPDDTSDRLVTPLAVAKIGHRRSLLRKNAVTELSRLRP
jgi:hypothetical protein